MNQLPLDGHCSGPLFAPIVKRRAPIAIRRANGWKWQLVHRRRATPKWASKWKIDLVYAFARLRGLTVDHIVPLRHPLVCGLHVEHNLQPLSGAENTAKGNLWWPDMPEEQMRLEL